MRPSLACSPDRAAPRLHQLLIRFQQDMVLAVLLKDWEQSRQQFFPEHKLRLTGPSPPPVPGYTVRRDLQTPRVITVRFSDGDAGGCSEFDGDRHRFVSQKDR